jgi:PAS domain S-box-containing protein
MATRRRKAASPPIQGSESNHGGLAPAAAADLAASEARYRALVEHSPNPCFVCRDGIIVFLNTAAVTLFGAAAAGDLLGRPILDRVHAEFRDVAQRRLQAIATGAGRVPATELRFLRVDGTTVDAEVDSTAIEFDGLAAVYATVNDRMADRRSDALLQSCARIIHQADTYSLDSLLQHTLDEAERLTGSGIGFAHFLDADQQTLTLQAWSTNTLNGMCTAEGKSTHYSVDLAGVWVDCVRLRAPVIHNDYAALTHRKGMPAGHAPVVRELVVPVMRDGLVTMILGVGNKPADYDARDLETVSRLTDLVWDIIQRRRAEEALQRTRFSVEAAADALFWITPDGRFLDVNAAACRSLGYSRDELLVLRVPAVDVHYNAEFWPAHFAELRARGTLTLESEQLTKDGRRFPVEVVANYLVLDGQEFNCAFVRDISERKRAEEGARRREEELRERDALMRTIAEHYPNAYVSIIEKDLTVGFTSGQAFKNRGLDANQFVGRTLDEVFGEWAPTVKAHYLRSFAGDEQSFTLEIHGEHQHYRSVPLRDAAGAIERILSVVEVIDERVRAEEQLQSSAALLAFSQGLTHTGSWELDAATQQLMWSDETYRIFGAVPQSFGATYDAFLEMVHPDDRAAVDGAFTRSVQEGSDAYALEHRIVRRDSAEVRLVREECRHERDAAGRVLRSVGVVQDLTEQRKLQDDRLRDALALELAMQASNAATWDWDVASGHINWSPGMFGLFGLDPAATTASFEAWRTALHPDDLPDAERRIMEALERRTSLNSEYRVVLADGGIRWIIATGRGFYDADGRPERMIGLCMDNTAFKRAQDERMAALELLERTGEMANVGGWELDLATQKLTFTRQSLKINEVDPSVGLDLTEALTRIDADHRPLFQAAVQAAIEHGTPYDLEVPMVTATGRHIWARTMGSAVYEAGTVARLRGTFQDVTERRLAEEERQRADARLHSWFALPLVGICVTSTEKGWLEVNDHLCEMLGYDRSELMRTTWVDLTHPEDLTKDVTQFERVLRGESDGYSLEKRFVRKDGSTLDADLSVRCVRKSDGTVDYCVALIRDISSRNRALAEKVVLESQLHHAQKMESVGRLAGGVAHDFNNMLGVILGNAEIALQQLDTTHPLHGDLVEIQAAAKRSAALTRQLLAFARRQAVAPEVLDVDQSVRELLAMLRRLLGEDISVQWMPAADLWRINMDPSQLANVLTNLCVNARDAISGVGSIAIGATNRVVDAAFCAAKADAVPGEYVCLSVRDTGSGIDAETLAHIFEPFFTTKGVSEGTGLGLASVYGAIRQNNGFVTVTSAVGEGSTFELFLPRCSGAASAALSGTIATAPRAAGETILLVEDEPGILRVTARVLQTAGYAVLQAGDASEALRVAGAHPGEIHLLLTDVVMPTLSGRDLANALSGVRPQIRCLYMSGHTADVIAHRGMLDPGVFFIEKPYSVAGLIAKVREVLDGE